MKARREADFVVLGAGPAGLAAGVELGDAAIVVEREARPGGLVRTEERGGYWFDRVLHLLYFADGETERRIRALLGPDLAECPPEAFVETRSGVARFPLQMHLGTLAPETIVRCLRDLAEQTFAAPGQGPANFEEMLLVTFGRALCDEFFFPYNRKLWKRPLSSLAPSGFQWNITRPELTQVLRGALGERDFTAYNGRGFYPRPPAGAPVRGMELLSRRLAERVPDLRLEHPVLAIDLDEQMVWIDRGGAAEPLHYRRGLVSTLPLPAAIEACMQAPAALVESCRRLTRNRVITVALAIAGPRPVGRGHWRYYADPAISFTRLVHLHEFDPGGAPDHGWGLLAELTEPAELPGEPDEARIARVLADLAAVGALPGGSSVEDAAVLVSDPGYVVFDLASRGVVDRAVEFLAQHRVEAVGRYGRWEYSSMAQVMRDGFAVARRLRERAAAGVAA